MPHTTPSLNTKKVTDLQSGKLLWIPLGPVPCAADPDSWTTEAHLGSGRKPDDPLRTLRERTKTARAICRESCPERDMCLATAMAEEGGRKAELRFGIRGGLLPQERETLYRNTKMKEKAAA